MGKTAVMIRLDDTELALLDQVCTESGTTRAGTVAHALKVHLRLAAGSMTTDRARELANTIPGVEILGELVRDEQPHDTVTRPVQDPATTQRIRAILDEPCGPTPDYLAAKARATRERSLKNPDSCAHPFRQANGYCPSCQDQR